MANHLRLVSTNPDLPTGGHVDGRTLHRLADGLIALVKSGELGLARTTVAMQHLSPFGIAIVARWMVRSGLTEEQILQVVV